MVQLESFSQKKRIKTQGSCKEIRGWFFENDEHCVAGECNPELVILFEDGTKEYAKNISENC